MSEPVNTHTTPNGMRLAFFEKPWRAYTINGEFDHPWTPEEPWGRVPSVTGVLGVLDKSGPLVGWATNLTCEGMWTLFQRPDFTLPSHWRGLQKELAKAGLDHRSATSEAQLRGSGIHKIGEDWVNEGKMPRPSDYPEAWQGYVRAIAGFLADWRGDFQLAEQITGSATHGYAGTCDTVAVVTGTDGERVRLDYKTSRQVYARSHFRQLEAYELAAVEGGEEPTDRRAIVCLYSTGTHEIAYVPPEHMGPRAFLNTLAVWRDEQPLKRLEDEAYKARRVRERGGR